MTSFAMITDTECCVCYNMLLLLFVERHWFYNVVLPRQALVQTACSNGQVLSVSMASPTTNTAGQRCYRGRNAPRVDSFSSYLLVSGDNY